MLSLLVQNGEVKFVSLSLPSIVVSYATPIVAALVLIVTCDAIRASPRQQTERETRVETQEEGDVLTVLVPPSMLRENRRMIEH